MTYAVVFDIDGVIRDVGNSYRRALADTVETYTGRLLNEAWRPSNFEIDELKREGLWNNDWEGSRELIARAWERKKGDRSSLTLDFDEMVAFFQSRYRGKGDNPNDWNGYINDEPLLVDPDYFERLTQGGVLWGFFSGATRGSAHYILTRRLQLTAPILHAMEDGPEKPDPTGLLSVVDQLEQAVGRAIQGVVYCGDTSSDMQALQNARGQCPGRQWKAVGVVPPHLWEEPERQAEHAAMMGDRGADIVLQAVSELTAVRTTELFTA
ncbi:MAG: TIGR01548 family HAD-type hydrolase [Synechococcus sp.]